MKTQTQRKQRTFIDTNILVYCDDAADRVKQNHALELVTGLMEARMAVVSLQVLQEYFVNVTRKVGIDPGLARQKVESFACFEVVEPSVSDVLAAIDLHRLYRVSYWDALILHCAQSAGCRIVLSEDMQHGQTIGGVRVVNPFL